MQGNQIRLLIADDQEIIRCGIKSLVAGTEINVVAEVTTGQAAVQYVMEHEVDVLLLDVRMPDGDGLNSLGRIKLDRPDQPIVMMSAFDNPMYIARSVALGANGFLVKGCTREQLIETIKTAAGGGSAWTRDGLRCVTGAMAAPRLNVDVEAPLTQREADVLKHLAGGLTNKQIAEALKISTETVKEHVQHLFRKIGVADRTQAAVWAVRKQLA